MKPYELVLVLKASLPSDEKKLLISSIQDILGEWTIKATDDIGVVNAAYLLQRKKENTNIHLISYHIYTDPKNILEYNKKFAYLNGLIRYFFYAMGVNEKFLTYTDLNKKFEETLQKTNLIKSDKVLS